MRHDHAADHAGRNTPAGGVAQLLGAFAILIPDARCLGEIGAEIVAGAGLQCLAILHHGLDRPCFDRAGETLILRLLAGDHRHGEVFLCAGAIDFEHPHGVLFRVGHIFMRGMPFLPQEFAGAQEHAGAHFPAHDIGPLVGQQWQVTPALHPARHRIADNRLGGRTDYQRLFELRFGIGDQPAFTVGDQPVMGDHRHFLGEAFDMLRLTLEIRQRDEDREIAIVMPRILDPLIEQALDAFPDAIAPRLDHHAAAHTRFLGEICCGDDFLIPLRKIVGALHRQGVADI